MRGSHIAGKLASLSRNSSTHVAAETKHFQTENSAFELKTTRTTPREHI
jgi:hypothetical protein